MLVGKYYDAEEFACECCGQYPLISQPLVELIDGVTDTFGRKLVINSAYRCNAHNEEVGGVVGSQHNANPLTAVDIDASELGVEEIAQAAEANGADGVGRYFSQKFVHMDVRSGRISDGYRWEEA